MMCCCLLLLLTLTSCVCAPTFVVKVTQSSYQAEENHNITLDWTFTTNTQGSLDSISIYCQMFTKYGVSVLYHLHEGVEAPQSPDEQLSGRVQCDRDVLREGRVRLHVSRLRTEDSGLYQCNVLTEYGGGSDTCHLKVTAAVDEPGPERPGPERPGPETPGPEGPGPERPGPETPEPHISGPQIRGRSGLYVGLTAAVLLVLLLCLIKLNVAIVHTAAETQSLSKNQSIRSTWTLSGPPSSVVSTEPEPKNQETESRTVSGSSTAGDVT